MSYEQDYIKRVLQKFAATLARALGLGKSGDIDGGLEALEQGVASELGLPLSMLLRLDAKSAVSLLGPGKATALAEALRTQSLLLELAGRSVEARAAAARADSIAAVAAGAPGANS